MLRFLFAGLVAVAGLVLLFAASFGDSDFVLNRFVAALSMTPQDSAPAAGAGDKPSATPAQVQVAVAENLPAPTPPEVGKGPAQPSSPAAQSSRPADQAAAPPAQREALTPQLQAQPAQASQSVSSPPNQVDEEQHPIDASQQQRDAGQASVGQPYAAPDNVAQAAEPLPLPPPLPANPPQPSPPSASATAAASPGPPPAPPAVQTDSGAMEAALERLRHESSAAPPVASPGPGIAALGTNEPAAMRRAGTAYDQPPQFGPRARLRMARASLANGRIAEAQQYLEEAQLQLVFRPVTPTGVDSSGSSPAAGDVAAALNAVGAGNVGAALAYVDRAMAEEQPGGYPPPQGYSYGGPYGGPPVAEARQ